MPETQHIHAYLPERADGRAYVWREYGSVAHLTESSMLSLPAWTVCGRLIPRQWRTRMGDVLRPLCSYCARWDAMVAAAQHSEVNGE